MLHKALDAYPHNAQSHSGASIIINYFLIKCDSIIQCENKFSDAVVKVFCPFPKPDWTIFWPIIAD